MDHGQAFQKLRDLTGKGDVAVVGDVLPPAPPAGVPGAMMSPGSMVMPADRAAMIWATEKTMLRVLACCRSSPFTRRRRMTFCGSGMAEGGAPAGPLGAQGSR